MIRETRRCILRAWQQEDAGSLYAYAGDPLVGPLAGWPPHKSLEESRLILTLVYQKQENFCIYLKEEREAVGMVCLMRHPHSNLPLKEGEAEVGFWLGSPFWGEGIMTEALWELCRYGFEDLGLSRLWGACYEENKASGRVMEKCGFTFQYRLEEVYVATLREKHTELVRSLSRQDFSRLSAPLPSAAL